MAKDRAPTVEEVRAALKLASPRERTAILIMASGGLRIGALPGLRLKDVEYLETQKAIVEEEIDRTAQTTQALRARPWKSKHLGPCPAELKGGVVMKSLVSLYAQKWSTRDQELGIRRMQLGPVGILCLNCQYHEIDL